MKSKIDLSEFVSGVKACSNGEPHESEWSESKTLGYSAQYQFEQLKEMKACSQRRSGIRLVV